MDQGDLVTSSKGKKIEAEIPGLGPLQTLIRKEVKPYVWCFPLKVVLNRHPSESCRYNRMSNHIRSGKTGSKRTKKVGDLVCSILRKDHMPPITGENHIIDRKEGETTRTGVEWNSGWTRGGSTQGKGLERGGIHLYHLGG